MQPVHCSRAHGAKRGPCEEDFDLCKGLNFNFIIYFSLQVYFHFLYENIFYISVEAPQFIKAFGMS